MAAGMMIVASVFGIFYFFFFIAFKRKIVRKFRGAIFFWGNDCLAVHLRKACKLTDANDLSPLGWLPQSLHCRYLRNLAEFWL